MEKEKIRSCPFCEAEIMGYSSGWGMSPGAWEQMKKEHDKYHKYDKSEKEKIREWLREAQEKAFELDEESKMEGHCLSCGALFVRGFLEEKFEEGE